MGPTEQVGSGLWGTVPGEQRQGLGSVLLRRCLADLHRAGMVDATIGWAGRRVSRPTGGGWIYRRHPVFMERAGVRSTAALGRDGAGHGSPRAIAAVRNSTRSLAGLAIGRSSGSAARVTVRPSGQLVLTQTSVERGTLHGRVIGRSRLASDACWSRLRHGNVALYKAGPCVFRLAHLTKSTLGAVPVRRFLR